MMFIIYS